MACLISRSPTTLDVGIRTAKVVRGTRDVYVMCGAAFLAFSWHRALISQAEAQGLVLPQPGYVTHPRLDRDHRNYSVKWIAQLQKLTLPYVAVLLQSLRLDSQTNFTHYKAEHWSV